MFWLTSFYVEEPNSLYVCEALWRCAFYAAFFAWKRCRFGTDVQFLLWTWISSRLQCFQLRLFRYAFLSEFPLFYDGPNVACAPRNRKMWTELEFWITHSFSCVRVPNYFVGLNPLLEVSSSPLVTRLFRHFSLISSLSFTHRAQLYLSRVGVFYWCCWFVEQKGKAPDLQGCSTRRMCVCIPIISLHSWSPAVLKCFSWMFRSC